MAVDLHNIWWYITGTLVWGSSSSDDWSNEKHAWTWTFEVLHAPALKNEVDIQQCDLTADLKVRFHTAINRADFVSWCMLYTYEGNKMHLWENDDVLSWVNH